MELTYYWSKLAKRLQGKSIRGSKISKKAYVNYGSNIVNSSMDDYSYCGYDCWIIETEIGKFCSISNQVHIGGPAHPVNWVSTSPVFHEGRNVLRKHFSKHSFEAFKKTYIGNDVWIGENVMIKSGVKIGNGAIIGMGSIVTKDVPAFEIWAGNPAKKIKERFDKNIKQKLLEIEWWNFNEEMIKSKSVNFFDVENFINEIEKEKSL